MVKVWFPSMFMRLVSVNTTKVPAEARLRVPPKMTKTEIKEYLNKIYNVSVTSITSTLFLGKWKRFYGKRKILSYKRANDKKVIVQFKEKDDGLNNIKLP